MQMEMTIHCFSFPGIMELGKGFSDEKSWILVDYEFGCQGGRRFTAREHKR